MFNIPNLNHEVSIIMASWQNPELLEVVVPTFKKNTQLDTRLFVALNEADNKSIEILKSYNISFVVLDKNWGTLAVDFLLPFLKSEYTIWINDDMIFSNGWDKKLTDIIKQYYPCAAQIRGVEKGQRDGIICLGDNDLPDFFDKNVYEKFNANVDNKKYNCDLIYGLFHPIMVRTKHHIAVNGVSNGFDMTGWPGHHMDTLYAYKLWQLDRNYKFIISNNCFDYHASSYTNKRLHSQAARNGINDVRVDPNKFENDAGMTHAEFLKIVKYGEKV